MRVRCVVSDAYRFICILIAKNATSTLREEFKTPRYQSYECFYEQLEPETRDTYFTFALLRDPVRRFLSAYQEISMRKDGQPLSERDKPFFFMGDTWARFQAFLDEAKQHKWDSHIVDQHAYIEDKRLDFLGTVETLDDSLRYVFERLNIPDYQPLPVRRSRQGRKTHYHYSRFYIDDVDETTKETLRELYKTDVALLTQVRETQRARVDMPGSMNAYLLHVYQSQNVQRQRYFVHHLGSRGGFIAELTLVARAMIYALGHNLQLVLDASEFAYTFEQGWTDYFEPFCAAYTPDMEPRVARHLRCCTVQKNRPPEELEHFNALKAFRPDRLRLGNLELHGFDEMMKLFLMAIFRLNRQTQHAVERLRRTLNLPDTYATVHIRRGDKVGDEDVYYPCERYMEKLLPLAPHTAIFVMSDDHQAVKEVQAYLAQRHLQHPVYSLCTEAHVGFDIWKVRERASYFGGDANPAGDDLAYRTYTYNETVRLLADLSIASASQKFVSTYRSNVGRTVRHLHPYPERCVLMQATPDLKQLLTSMQQASGKRQPLRVLSPPSPHQASIEPDGMTAVHPKPPYTPPRVQRKPHESGLSGVRRQPHALDESRQRLDAFDAERPRRHQALSALLRQASKNRLVLVMMVNHGYMDMFRNWVRSCDVHAIEVRSWSVVFTTDTDAAREVTELGFTTYTDPASYGEQCPEAVRTFGDMSFRRLMFQKTAIVQDVLQLGYDVLFQDVDVVWRKEPLAYLLHPARQRFDAQFMYDGPNPHYVPLHVNSGFFLLRQTLAAKTFWHTVLANYDLMILRAQQAVVNLILLDRIATGLQFDILPQQDFANGHLFGPHNASRLPRDPYVVHCSWTGNMPQKVVKYKRARLWYLDGCQADTT